MLDTTGDGLYNKYVIAKCDGSPIDPQARYFVLRLDTDRCARAAAYHYAECIAPKWPGLAADLRKLLGSLLGPHTGG